MSDAGARPMSGAASASTGASASVAAAAGDASGAAGESRMGLETPVLWVPPLSGITGRSPRRPMARAQSDSARLAAAVPSSATPSVSGLQRVHAHQTPAPAHNHSHTPASAAASAPTTPPHPRTLPHQPLSAPLLPPPHHAGATHVSHQQQHPLTPFTPLFASQPVALASPTLAAASASAPHHSPHSSPNTLHTSLPSQLSPHLAAAKHYASVHSYRYAPRQLSPGNSSPQLRGVPISSVGLGLSQQHPSAPPSPSASASFSASAATPSLSHRSSSQFFSQGHQPLPEILEGDTISGPLESSARSSARVSAAHVNSEASVSHGRPGSGSGAAGAGASGGSLGLGVGGGTGGGVAGRVPAARSGNPVSANAIAGAPQGPANPVFPSSTLSPTNNNSSSLTPNDAFLRYLHYSAPNPRLQNPPHASLPASASPSPSQVSLLPQQRQTIAHRHFTPPAVPTLLPTPAFPPHPPSQSQGQTQTKTPITLHSSTTPPALLTPHRSLTPPPLPQQQHLRSRSQSAGAANMFRSGSGGLDLAVNCSSGEKSTLQEATTTTATTSSSPPHHPSVTTTTSPSSLVPASATPSTQLSVPLTNPSPSLSTTAPSLRTPSPSTAASSSPCPPTVRPLFPPADPPTTPPQPAPTDPPKRRPKHPPGLCIVGAEPGLIRNMALRAGAGMGTSRGTGVTGSETSLESSAAKSADGIAVGVLPNATAAAAVMAVATRRSSAGVGLGTAVGAATSLPALGFGSGTASNGALTAASGCAGSASWSAGIGALGGGGVGGGGASGTALGVRGSVGSGRIGPSSARASLAGIFPGGTTSRMGGSGLVMDAVPESEPLPAASAGHSGCGGASGAIVDGHGYRSANESQSHGILDTGPSSASLFTRVGNIASKRRSMPASITFALPRPFSQHGKADTSSPSIGDDVNSALGEGTRMTAAARAGKRFSLDLNSAAQVRRVVGSGIPPGLAKSASVLSPGMSFVPGIPSGGMERPTILMQGGKKVALGKGQSYGSVREILVQSGRLPMAGSVLASGSGKTQHAPFVVHEGMQEGGGSRNVVGVDDPGVLEAATSRPLPGPLITFEEVPDNPEGSFTTGNGVEAITADAHMLTAENMFRALNSSLMNGTTSTASLDKNHRVDSEIGREASTTDLAARPAQTRPSTLLRRMSLQSAQQTPIHSRENSSSIPLPSTLGRRASRAPGSLSRKVSIAPDASTGSATAADLDSEAYRTNPDYYEYLLQNQRVASSQFIQKMDSNDIIWRNEETVVKMIGPYILGDKIGKGSFGKVKEGICTETLQRVAVKIINKKRLRKVANGVENTIREIKLMRDLRHKNVIRLIDVFCKMENDEGVTGLFNWYEDIENEPIQWRLGTGDIVEKQGEIQKWYLVFEYCPCSLQSMLDHVGGNKLPIPEAHNFFIQLMEGVAYLHTRSVIHRDIKPGNLLVSADGTLKITDFGITEQFDMFDPEGMWITTFAGTHQFLSPEITSGVARSPGEMADIWACGVTLYNMISGKYPFEFPEEGNLMGLHEKISLGKFEVPTDIDEDLADLLRGILEVNLSERLDVRRVLLHRWSRMYFEPTTLGSVPIFLFQTDDHKMFEESSRRIPVPADFSQNTESKFNDGTVPRREKGLNATTTTLTLIRRPPPIPLERGTTLMPFLEQLFEKDIEADLNRMGTVVDIFRAQRDIARVRVHVVRVKLTIINVSFVHPGFQA
ncbi:Serine/threonine-protein kinase stk11 [Gonapodya sp. JEL0774]|nr:Serine/threonine-protein kinase stk11 [Gonapodya sp. JEL0774]